MATKISIQTVGIQHHDDENDEGHADVPLLAQSTSDSESSSCEDACDTEIMSKASLIDKSRRFEDNLKYDKKEAEEGEAAMTAEDRHACVQFDSTVLGVEILSHRDYPESERRLMWNSFQEIQENADRNINEFRSDGWEWRNATEESEMVVQSVGELVHPASYKCRKESPKRKGGRKKNRMHHHRRKGRHYTH